MEIGIHIVFFRVHSMVTNGSMSQGKFTRGLGTGVFLASIASALHDFKCLAGGHGGRVVTLSPPASEAGLRFPAQPQVGTLAVACCWSAVYSTEP